MSDVDNHCKPESLVDLATLAERAIRQFGNSIACEDGNRSSTFRELGTRTGKLANGLLAKVSEPGARVAVLMSNSLEFVEADIAILRAGLGKVPINPKLSEDERRFVLVDSGASILITDAQNSEFAHSVLSEIDSLDTVVVVGGDGAAAYETFLANASSSSVAIGRDPDSVSVILYTSGTTGRPKGAVATLRTRTAAVTNMLSTELQINPGDGMLHAGPLSHGSGSKVVPFMLRGGRNVVSRRFDPAEFLALAAARNARFTFLVPTMIAMLTDEARRVGSVPQSLRRISYGGSPINEATILEAIDVFGQVFTQVYGSCEAPHPVTVLSRHDHTRGIRDHALLSSAGYPSLAVSLSIVDESNRTVGSGKTGELAVSGPGVMVGYWRDANATNTALVDGWYRTGDIGSIGSDGLVRIADRKSGMIISGGLNVYPAEVERVLALHPDVLEVAVIGVPDQKWGESVHAFVVPRSGAGNSTSGLIEHCRRLMAGYKKPRTITWVQELPHGSTGKIDKAALQASVQGGKSNK